MPNGECLLTRGIFFARRDANHQEVIMFLKDFDSGRIRIHAMVMWLVVVVVLMGSVALYH